MKRLSAAFLALLLAFAAPGWADLRATSGAFGPAGITSGTITGTNVSYALTGSAAIPFISLSSGSVSAVGAISGITALPVVYASAYCYFPANILATAIAAGWYYCTFSSTTAGTAFLNTYTSGAPTIPGSPTAVTDGKGAFTGDTGEEFGPTITVPAGAIGANGQLRTTGSVSQLNNANVKTLRVRLSGNAGTIFGSAALTSFGGATYDCPIDNRGSQSVQHGRIAMIASASTSSVSTGVLLGAVDTSVATTLVLSLQKATATDNIILETYRVLVNFGS